MKRKMIVAVAGCAAMLLALTGCADAGQLDMQGRTIYLPDGREVICVGSIDTFNGGSGGVSCDWENAR
ncbi:hypothetical protein HOT82_gp013 [Gordonia phage Ronaldo]|uniref:Lipoprotein n=3 Tax=Ronaldovirus ronaldo TaxID=2734270 RepID=A0A6B9L8T3_9CAUD|nr:hypothetical protein HOT82_gp013 [Gordonia phage Ronaldo]AXN53575.1 hypothetical protein SEA_RONALDO_13 [Gordonia phage Ronaldo]QDH48353.1 lipoprotein [Gordonia phage Ziko]QHB38130.1 hypothetical protein SEA_VOLT_13 [Gordonia phage Volt]